MYVAYHVLLFILRGFSVVDLLEDAHSHKLFALKRITCHGKIDERVATQEVEVMRSFRHRHIVPLVESSMITVGHHVESQDPITEMLIVMPFYKVSYILLQSNSNNSFFGPLHLMKINHMQLCRISQCDRS